MPSPDAIDAEIAARVFAFLDRHFLQVEQLSRQTAERLIALAGALADRNRAGGGSMDLLAGRIVAQLFFENSTRTRTSFEIAARRLGAEVVNLDIATSSTAKGETLIDTAKTIDAMGVDLMVIRHSIDGAPAAVAEQVRARLINAGDGRTGHPTQALLDALTLQRAFGRIEGLTVAICGDVANSRVARSNAVLLGTLGATVRLVAPAAFMRPEAAALGAEVFDDLRAGVAGADAVMMLRLQRERMAAADCPSPDDYFRTWGLTREVLALAAPGAKVMHPGPMNREVEIASDVADDPAVSLIRDQVEMGVAARMAVLACLAS